MALCNINDINLEILFWVTDFKLFINLSIIDKKSFNLYFLTITPPEQLIFVGYLFRPIYLLP